MIERYFNLIAKKSIHITAMTVVIYLVNKLNMKEQFLDVKELEKAELPKVEKVPQRRVKFQ